MYCAKQLYLKHLHDLSQNEVGFKLYFYLMKKIPLKDLLVKRIFCSNEKEATSKILSKKVKVDNVFCTSPNELVFADCEVEIKPEKKFVSRGGYKLEHALDKFNISVKGAKCLDIGSSTGGFSDCLLQHGAKSVSCVDVNYGQLAWEVRKNPKTKIFERTNIKCATCEQLGGPFDIIVIDVSFIGLASLAKKIATFCNFDGGRSILIALVKPQFESRKDEVEGGLVKDCEVKTRVVEEVKEALSSAGFKVKGVEKSPILGKKMKNEEFLIYAEKC